MFRTPYSVAAEDSEIVGVEEGVRVRRSGASLIEELRGVGGVGVEAKGVADGERVDGDAAESCALLDADGVVEGDRVRGRRVREVERLESSCEGE